MWFVTCASVGSVGAKHKEKKNRKGTKCRHAREGIEHGRVSGMCTSCWPAALPPSSSIYFCRLPFLYFWCNSFPHSIFSLSFGPTFFSSCNCPCDEEVLLCCLTEGGHFLPYQSFLFYLNRCHILWIPRPLLLWSPASCHPPFANRTMKKKHLHISSALWVQECYSSLIIMVIKIRCA